MRMQVRVPLNTACKRRGKILLMQSINFLCVVLAVQNMKAVGAIGKNQEQDVEFAALEGSLSMMSKGEGLSCNILILNDSATGQF